MSQEIKYSNVGDGEYPIMEEFYTVQGEGFWTGTAAYFIRIAGCDVGCSWCDVKESWPFDQHPIQTVSELMESVGSSKAKHIVVTGGEPTIYPLKALTQKGTDLGYKMHLETSGAYAITGDWHWICFSPKKFKAPHTDVYAKAHELKVIVLNKSDLEFARTHGEKVNKDCKLYLQPEWSKKEKVMPLIVDFVKENPEWKISLQTHKYLNIP